VRSSLFTPPSASIPSVVKSHLRVRLYSELTRTFVFSPFFRRSFFPMRHYLRRLYFFPLGPTSAEADPCRHPGPPRSCKSNAPGPPFPLHLCAAKAFVFPSSFGVSLVMSVTRDQLVFKAKPTPILRHAADPRSSRCFRGASRGIVVILDRGSFLVGSTTSCCPPDSGLDIDVFSLL